MSTLSELLHTHGIPWFSFLTSTCLGFARGVSASASSFLGMRRKVPPAGPRKRSTHRRLRPMRARKASLDAARYDRYVVSSSKHGIGAMVIHPILGIITMGILTPLDGCMTIPFYEKTKHVLTGSMRTQSTDSHSMHRWRRYEVETCNNLHTAEDNLNYELIPTSLLLHECHIFLVTSRNVIFSNVLKIQLW